MCLDCGMRLAYDLSAIGVVTSVHGSNLDRQKSVIGKENVLTISALQSMPAAPERRKTMRAGSRRLHRDFGTPAVLWIGAMRLAGGIFYSLDQPAQPRNLTAPKEARPPLSAGSVKSSRSLPAQEQEPDTEATPVHEATTPANAIVSREPYSPAGYKTIEPDSISASVAPQPSAVLRLEGARDQSLFWGGKPVRLWGYRNIQKG